VLVVDEESHLQRKTVKVAWSDDERVVVSEGLDTGDVVTLTSLSIAASGTLVRATIDGRLPDTPMADRGNGSAATGQSGR
jgi:hypothetical protein